MKEGLRDATKATTTPDQLLLLTAAMMINQSTVLFHHTNIKIKAQTYTVTNIITATPVKVKQKSNIYIL